MPQHHQLSVSVTALAEARVFDHDERQSIKALARRITHLADRTRGNPDLSFDRREIKALLWALNFVDAERLRREADANAPRITVTMHRAAPMEAGSRA